MDNSDSEREANADTIPLIKKRRHLISPSFGSINHSDATEERQSNEKHINYKAVNGIDDPDHKEGLPTIVLLLMKITCVFHHSSVTCDRICHLCKMDKYPNTVSEHGHSVHDITVDYLHVDPLCQWYHDPDRAMSAYEKLCQERDQHKPQTTCLLCNSFWWNYDGVVERYKDKDIGVASWNHTGSWLLSLMIVFFALVFLVWDFLYYIAGIWGDPTQIIHLLNYGNFMLLMAVYPLCNLCSKLEIVFGGGQRGLSWTTALNARFILKRLQFVGFRQKGIPGKALFAYVFFMPSLVAAYRGFVYLHQGKHFTLHSGLSVVCCGIIMWMSSNFLYLSYLTRLSFERQFHLISEYLKSHHENLDNCRQVLGNAIQDFNCFRKFVSLYTVVFAPVITWCVTTQVVWQYFVHDALCPGADNTQTEEIILVVTLVSWSNIIFSSSTILWSFGGLNISYVINDFRRGIVTTSEVIGMPRNWKRLIRFIDIVTHFPSYGVSATTFLSAIGFFLALKLDPKQATTYFKKIICNETTIHPAPL